MDRKALEEKAKKLGIDFNEDTSDEDLKDLIEEAEDKNNSDPEYLKSEMKKAIDSRDKAKKDKRKIKEELDSTKEEIKKLNEKIKGLPDGDELEDLKEELKELKEYKETVEEEKRKAAEDKMSAEEKYEARIKRLEEQADKRERKAISETEKRFKEQLDEATKKIDKYDKTVSSLRNNKLESDIIKSANKHGAIKPEGIFKMIKDEFEYDADEGKFYHYSKNKEGKIKDEKDVDEYVKEFLSDEDNDYLVKADVRGNSFHSNNNSDDKNNRRSHKDYGKYNPKDPEIQEKADEVGLSVEDYIETEKMRDAKMEKVNANRK